MNRLFVLFFENVDDRRSHSGYYPKVEIKDYNVMIDGKKLFDRPIINNDFKTCGNIRKIATGQADDYTTGCLLDYPYFKNKI